MRRLLNILLFTVIILLPINSFAMVFYLITANQNSSTRNTRIGEIQNNTLISNVGTMLNIEAALTNTNATCSRVEFRLTGAISLSSTERQAPYALFGDDNGIYKAWNPPSGNYALTARAFNANNSVFETGTVNFRVINNYSSSSPSTSARFTRSRGDLISLHFDFCADYDDGHSVAADRTLTRRFNVTPHVVWGAYGTNYTEAHMPFRTSSSRIMNSAFGNGWLDAHNNRSNALNATVSAWRSAMNAGGHIWVAESGQSDFTADVLNRLSRNFSQQLMLSRIHIVQHSSWNENYTTPSALNYVKRNTHYIKIADGNSLQNYPSDPNNEAYRTAGLRITNNNDNRRETIGSFVSRAESHPQLGNVWMAAFDFLNPEASFSNDTPDRGKLDFSDTVELLYILNIRPSQVSGCQTFANQFLN